MGLLSPSSSATAAAIQHSTASSNDGAAPTGPTATRYRIAATMPAATSLEKRSRISLRSSLIGHLGCGRGRTRRERSMAWCSTACGGNGQSSDRSSALQGADERYLVRILQV